MALRTDKKMNPLGNLKSSVIGVIIFPATSYLLNRKRINKNSRNLGKSEWYSQDFLQELQLRKLIQTVDHAYKHVPYYKKKFKQIGLTPRDINELQDIRSLPVLSRQDVIDQHQDMVDARFASSIPVADQSKRDAGAPIPLAILRKHRLIRNTSSGSTGAPTVFYEDGSRSALNWVHELRLKSWYGVYPGSKEARMVRLATEYMPKDKMILMRKMLWRQLLLPGTNLSDSEYSLCLEKILDFRPKVLWGYTSALAGLAGYILRNKAQLSSYRPELIVGWAAPVYEHEEKILKEAFQCPVSNIYSAREVGHVAGKCPNGSFHINQENNLVEIERVQDKGVANGLGEVLVTTLDQSPMPFIRYRMGDVGELQDSRCSCGRSLQVLTNLLGRTGEIFMTKGGRMISPNFWCRTFMSGHVSGAVKRFQIVYKKSKDLKIRLEKDERFSNGTETYIRDTVAENFSRDTELEIEYVPRIEPEISGKYQMVTWEG